MCISNIKAQTVVSLWNYNPPSENGLVEQEVTHNDFIVGVSDPKMIIYLPDSANNNKKAIIICPGGGYGGLAINHEGHQFAQWLTDPRVYGCHIEI